MPVPRVNLKLSDVSARSGAGTGIRSVSFEVTEGSVHGLLGENSSGVSEVLAVIGGYLAPQTGTLEVDGAEVHFGGREAAEAAGIAVNRGEPSIVAQLTVAENVCLGHETAVGGFVRFDRLYASAKKLLASLGLTTVKVARPAGELSPGERRVVEFGRALVAGRRVLLLDEPFTGLDARELSVVADGIAGLARAGVTVLVATYRIDMLRRVAESVTVLSRGQAVETLSFAGAEIAAGEARLIGYMTQNIEVTRRIRHEAIEPGPVVLDVRNWSVSHPVVPGALVLNGVSLTVRRGEIVGLAGLEGSGVSELVQSLYGRSYGSAISGELLLNDRPIAPKSPADAIAAGLSLSTEADTKYDLGLIGGIPSRVTPSALARLAKLGLIDPDRQYRTAAPAFGLGGISELVTGRGGAGGVDVGGGGGASSARTAGGHRHRDALQLWLDLPADSRPTVVLLDHPTRGAGVEEAQEISDLIVQLAASGTGVLLVSGQLEEVLVMTTRVYTMAEGRVTSAVSTLDATPQSLLASMITGIR